MRNPSSSSYVCGGVIPLCPREIEVHSCYADQTPPPRELKVSDPKIRDLSLLQLQLVPTAVLHVKFIDESLNRESRSESIHSSLSAPFVDNDVQAPLIPSVLAAAIDLPLPSNTTESDDEPHSRRGRTLGSTSAQPSTSSQKGKPGLSAGEAQKKIGRLFKGLIPSKAFSLTKGLD